MRIRDDIDIQKLKNYGFHCVDVFGDETYIWNEDANISINLEDRSIYVYGQDEEDYQDLSVLYKMFKDGILESKGEQ